MPEQYIENELDFNNDSGFASYADGSAFESDLADILAILGK